MPKESGKRRQSIEVDTDLLKDMVTTAFQGSPTNKLTTEDIYKTVFKNFPNIGNWSKPKLDKFKTTIRTVLSRYECFSKLEKAMKGNYWQFNEGVSAEAKKEVYRKKTYVQVPSENDPSLGSKLEAPEDDMMETALQERRPRKAAIKASSRVSKTLEKRLRRTSKKATKLPDKGEHHIESDTEEQERETDKVSDDVDEDESVVVESKEPESDPCVEQADTPTSDQAPKGLDSSEVDPKSETENEPKRNENSVTSSPTEQKTIADPGSDPLPNSPALFAHPSSPSTSTFVPSSTHFGQPSPPNHHHTYGSLSPHTNSFGHHPPPSSNPYCPQPPNYQVGGYCSPNGQFGMPNHQFGYSSNHFGYSSVPIGMPNSHFGYSSSHFYPSPPPHPFGLPSPFHYPPPGHPSTNRF